ncbi:Flp pilus assembly complex ATPase component TadA [bacterium]|nr:Flp pilus assembly complex ATPase component TadA [bacterium]
MKKKSTDMLIDRAMATASQLEVAEQTQLETGGNLADVRGKGNYVSKEVPAQQSGANSDVPKINLSLDLIDPDAAKVISPEMAQHYKIIPIVVDGGILKVAMADPLDLIAIDNVRMASGLTIEPVACGQDKILKAIDFFFGRNGKHLKVHEAWRDSSVQYLNRGGEEDALETDEVEDAPTVRLLNSTLARAVDDGASDIHIEPAEDAGRVRFRLDGILHRVNVLPRQVIARLISRIKILSSLDIAEKRIPQDGRFFVRCKQKDIDLRVATLPTIYGESCVIRLLDQSKSNIRLESIGFTQDQRELIVRALGKTAGLVLVTGPTGSGKTTTLCAMLNHVNSLEKKTITIEDPVEYRLSVVNQITTNPVGGLTFASALRSILRNDPDIILVGEIRDAESAAIAVQASLTGHLLLSTLHTTGTAESLMRLIDLGLEPFYVREVVDLIVAQRLVRVLCKECKEPYNPSPEVRASLGGIDGGLTLFRAVGCPECRKSGYKGRTAVFEVLSMTDSVRRILMPGTRAAVVRELARKEGMNTSWESAVGKVLQGETSVEEIRKHVPGNPEADAGVGLAPRMSAGSNIAARGRKKAEKSTNEAACLIHLGERIVGNCYDCQKPLCRKCVGAEKGYRLLCKECTACLRMLRESCAVKDTV